MTIMSLTPTFYRKISTSICRLKIVPSNLKGKSKSSQDWITRQLNDEYVKKSKYDRYRCRSAYKLLEIDERFKIFKPGFFVVDCGAAPGSWTQVVVKKLNLRESEAGIAVAVDLQYMEDIEGAIVIKQSNFLEQTVQDHICSLLPNGKCDVVLSDMAPKATGTYELDSVAIVTLASSALKFATKTLKKDGTFLCKLWDCSNVETMVSSMKNIFSSVKRIKPKASRSDSSELFLLARGYKL
ncbi:rRNA methyltransferase 2, mitochondrial-like [Uloborus diversus]|uniref:rRNA methyltransferase 2, mitochondrial-like n=1 Tax=Uloborus diversus TaxID=327109 RepID=UPI002409E212|nr:rRNA methyltransferase 2, mitochondrial-like [Uloborus diversus]